MKRIIFLLAAGSFMLVACNDATKTETNKMTSSDSTTFDLSKTRADIEADNVKFIDHIRKGDSNALADHYHSEGQVLMVGMEPILRKDIAAGWGGFLSMGVKDFKLNTLDLVGNDDLLVETGTYEMIGANNAVLDKGKYVVAWKKENGQWKIYRDIATSSVPMPQAK